MKYFFLLWRFLYFDSFSCFLFSFSSLFCQGVGVIILFSPMYVLVIVPLAYKYLQVQGLYRNVSKELKKIGEKNTFFRLFLIEFYLDTEAVFNFILIFMVQLMGDYYYNLSDISFSHFSRTQLFSFCTHVYPFLDHLLHFIL